MYFEILLGSFPVLIKRNYAQIIVTYNPLLLEKDKCGLLIVQRDI